MVTFFEQSGRYVRCETRQRDDGQYELTVTLPDGTVRTEIFEIAAKLDERVRQLEHDYVAGGWFGPYGQRA